MSKDIRKMINDIKNMSLITENTNDSMDINVLNRIPKGEIFHDRLNPTYYAQLRDNIKNNGVKEPIILNYYNQDNALTLKDGHHRLQLANELGIDRLPIRIVVVWRNNIDPDYPIYHPPVKLDVEGYRRRDYYPTNILSSELGF